MLILEIPAFKISSDNQWASRPIDLLLQIAIKNTPFPALKYSV